MSLLREFCQFYLPSKKIDPSDIELAFEGLGQQFEYTFSREDANLLNSLFCSKISVFNSSFFTNCYFRFSKEFVKDFLKKRSIQNGQGSDSWVPGHGNWSMGILFKEGACSGCYYSAIQDYWSGSTENFYEDIIVGGSDTSPIMVCENLGDFASFEENWNNDWSPISICFKPNCWVDCPDIDPEYFAEVLIKIMKISTPRTLKTYVTPHETCFYLSTNNILI